jgi:hypothetical protein
MSNNLLNASKELIKCFKEELNIFNLINSPNHTLINTPILKSLKDLQEAINKEDNYDI